MTIIECDICGRNASINVGIDMLEDKTSIGGRLQEVMGDKHLLKRELKRIGWIFRFEEKNKIQCYSCRRK